jgi:hypothetical protein
VNASIRLSFALVALLLSACAAAGPHPTSLQRVYRETRVAQQPSTPAPAQSFMAIRSNEGSRSSVH